MMSDTKSFLSDSQFQQLAAFRKELHTHPEVSGNEHETAKRVLTYLDNLNPSSVMHTFGGTGIIATYDSRKAGPTLLFRAELDALPERLPPMNNGHLSMAIIPFTKHP